MVLIDLAEWVVNFFLIGVSFIFVAIGMFIMTVIFYAVLDRKFK
jgi:hypothetical protein